MSKKLARLLRADIQETSDLKSIAKMLAGKGRGGDTILAHITPKEVSLLKEAGGAGTVNPETGLLEFYDGFEDFAGTQQDILSAITPQSYDYIPPQNAPESSFAVDYSAPAQQLTPSGIDPSQYYMEQAAGQQYAGSAFPYPPAQAGTPDVGWNEAIVPGTARDVALQEFPPSSAAYLNLGAQGVTPAVQTSPEAARAAAAERVAGGGAAGPTPKTLTERAGDVLSAIKAGGGDVLDYLKKNPELLKLGTSGVGALLTAQKAKQGAQQVQQATTEQKQIASPYQKLGGEIQRQALAGELSPQEVQSLQAARAQIAQGIESRGGVGVAQAQAQLESLRQNLLQQKLDYGIKLSSIGDQIAIGAIRTGLQADQAVNQLTNSMYSNMLAIASGIPPQQIRTTATPGAA